MGSEKPVACPMCRQPAERYLISPERKEPVYTEEGYLMGYTTLHAVNGYRAPPTPPAPEPTRPADGLVDERTICEGWATSAAQHLCSEADQPAAIRLLTDAFVRARAEAAAHIARTDALLEEARGALGSIAAKNDLSQAQDDEVEAYARAALYDCELIARAALDTLDAAAIARSEP